MRAGQESGHYLNQRRLCQRQAWDFDDYSRVQQFSLSFNQRILHDVAWCQHIHPDGYRSILHPPSTLYSANQSAQSTSKHMYHHHHNVNAHSSTLSPHITFGVVNVFHTSRPTNNSTSWLTSILDHSNASTSPSTSLTHCIIPYFESKPAMDLITWLKHCRPDPDDPRLARNARKTRSLTAELCGGVTELRIEMMVKEDMPLCQVCGEK